MPPPLVRCALLATSILLAWGRSTAAANLSGYFLDEQEQGRVTVDTKLGPVTGLAFPGGVRGFMGIPYALPPIKTLRFEPPVPLTSWGGGRLDATEFGDNCMQSIPADSPPTRISEDCLFLNVWTPPGARKGSKLPVMIWLYGGGFQQGASSHPEYDGRRLAQKGVLVVSINYRLGALGWMVSVAENLWGNYGLQDQRLGMEWVHDNIVSFGGDPGRVTVFGESAGAMCIGQHLHSDKAGVLFQQAVMQSNPLGYRFRSVTVANFLGEAMKLKLDCHSLECLQSESAADVLRVQETLMGLPRSVGDFFTWGPVVPDRNYYRHVGENQKQFSYSSQEEEEEKEARDKKKKKTINLFGDPPAHPDDDDAGSSRKKKNADLTLVGPISYTAPSMKVVQPLQVMAAAASSATAARVARAGGGGGGDGRGGRAGGEDRGPLPIPVMLGVNAEEGVMFVHLAFPVTMPRLVYQSFVFALFRSSTLGVLHTYGAVADQCAESGDYRKVMSHIMHDYLFRCPNLRAAQLLQEKNGREAPVFVYEFTHPTEIDGLPACAGLACHTSELPYVFNNMDIIKTNYSYHEAGKPGATSFPPPVGLYAEDGGVGGEGGGGGGGGGGGPLSAVGNALGGVAGGVAGGVTGVVRSGFGIRRLFGRRGMSSPAEEVEGAIGGGAVGFAGKVVAAAVGSDDAGDISGEGEGEGGAGGGIGGGGAGSVLEDGAELGVGGAGEAGAGTSRNVGGAAASAAAADADGSQKGSHKDSREGSQKDAPASPKRGSATTRRGEDGTEGGGGGGANPSSQGASGDGDSDGIGSMTGERGLGGSNCAAAPARDTPGVGGASGSLRPRPTVAEAAEADALVGDAMVNYWASFGKAGDPNSANAPVLWPAWEGRQLTAQGRTSGALALDSVIAAGRGGVGKGSFSDDFAQAWLRAGADAMGGGGGGGGAGGSGSYFLEIRAHPRVKEAERDCLCEFWDRTKYKH